MSEEERDHILKMIEEGTINATEGADLLASIAGEEEDLSVSDWRALPGAGDKPWEVPLITGIVLSGFGLLGIIRGRRVGVLGRIGAWATFFLGFAAIVVGFWSRNAPWLHIRVQETDGETIHIRLPLPLPLAMPILSMVRGLVDAETAAHIDSAMAFVDGLQRGEQQDPLSIEVDDGEGNQVQIAIA